MKNTMKIVKVTLHITKDVKIQDSRQLLFKKIVLGLSERRETQIMKFNSHPTHLVCNARHIANFLSFHMSLVVVMN